jgi:hypothetical protein
MLASTAARTSGHAWVELPPGPEVVVIGAPAESRIVHRSS